MDKTIPAWDGLIAKKIEKKQLHPTGKMEYKIVKDDCTSWNQTKGGGRGKPNSYFFIDLWHHVFGRATFKLVTLSLRKCQFGRYN